MTPQPYNQVRLGSDILAVVNSGAHTILMVELKDGAEIMRIGSGTMGFADGPAAEARFSNPRHVYNPSSPPLHLVVSFFLPCFLPCQCPFLLSRASDGTWETLHEKSQIMNHKQ